MRRDFATQDGTTDPGGSGSEPRSGPRQPGRRPSAESMRST